MAATLATNTDAVSALLGDLKETYANEMKNLRPQDTTLQEKFPVEPGKEPIGNAFHVPLLVTHSQSTTYDTNQGTKTLTAITAPDSVDAQIPARELSERMLIPYGMLKQSGMGKNVVFLTETVLKMIALDEALRRQVEFSLLYGGSYVAQINVVTYGGGGATTATLTLVSGTYAPGYLSGCENAPWDIYQTSTGTTQRNTNALIRCTVIDPIGGTATISGNATDLGNVANSDYIFRYNEVGSSITGLAVQLANTSSTLFTNMVPGNYNLLKGNVQGSVGNFAVSRLLKYIAVPKNKGLKGDATCLVSPDGFSCLANDLASLRRFDGTYSKGQMDSGAETIKLRAGGVSLEIIEHMYLRSAESYVFKDESIMRPGVSDITDNIAGMDLAVMSSSSNGFEFRKWTSQAIFCSSPARGLQLTGLTYPG